MMENQPLLTSADGSSDKIPAESSTGPLYSQDCSQEHNKIPPDYQKDNLIGATAEDKEMPCEEKEPIGTDVTGSPIVAEIEEEDEGIKEEEILAATGDTRGTQRNVTAEKEEEGHISIKEENLPTEVGAGEKGSDKPSQLKKDRSKMDVYVDPGELVDLIQARPELWDIGSDGYNNSILKSQSWEAVTSHFFQDFPQRSSETRSKMLKEMKKKWKSLRDRFKKDLKFERKSRSEQTPIKYKYHPLFHKMSFLISSLEKRLTSGNVENEEEEEDDNEGQSQEQRHIGHAEVGPSKNRERAEEGSNATSFPPEKSEVSPVLISSQSPKNPLTKKGRTGQAKTDPQKDVIKMMGRVSESSERVVRPKDGISYFLQSLEGDIRKVAPDRLTKLKMDLMKVVYEAQQLEREQGHSVPSSSQYPSNFYPLQSCSYCHHFHSPQPSAYPYAPPHTHSSGYTYASSQPHISSYHQASVPTQSRSPAMPDQLSSTGHPTEEMPGSSLQTSSRSSIPILEDI
ncbi:DNA ligase 1-like [Hyperolius riggenbachi]|uniref:DNA ligase 1-like n=1 Tax=Hyperolius riggenbachi TaxID=752182 RepID=UPI0035A2F889